MFNSFTLKLVMLLLLSLNMIACTGSSTTGTTLSGDSGTSSGSTTDSQTAKITLSWVAPSTWVDDTAISLSEISGYRLYYGPTASNTPNMVDINDPTSWKHTLTLEPGTYYFRVSTYDVNGIEGPKSEAISGRA